MAKNNSSQAPKTRPKFWEAISVKFIIIFWFTLLMVIVSALVMVFMLTVSRLTMEPGHATQGAFRSQGQQQRPEV